MKRLIHGAAPRVQRCRLEYPMWSEANSQGDPRMHDAIVVGARVAGAPTAMLLARRGYRVLLVDRDTFPSDIMSTHYIHQPGVAKLRDWGLLERVLATDCPPIER